MVNAPLQHTTSVSMSGNLNAVGSNGVVNELVVFGRQLVQTFLDDVVSVEVLDQADDIQAESDNDGPDLVGLTSV